MITLFTLCMSIDLNDYSIYTLHTVSIDLNDYSIYTLHVYRSE